MHAIICFWIRWFPIESWRVDTALVLLQGIWRLNLLASWSDFFNHKISDFWEQELFWYLTFYHIFFSFHLMNPFFGHDPLDMYLPQVLCYFQPCCHLHCSDNSCVVEITWRWKICIVVWPWLDSTVDTNMNTESWRPNGQAVFYSSFMSTWCLPFEVCEFFMNKFMRSPHGDLHAPLCSPSDKMNVTRIKLSWSEWHSFRLAVYMHV